jgi:metallo-beta-lactamase class B
MHDGQNLFDPAAAYCGEWGVDKSLDFLFSEGRTKGAIVVGVDNGGTGRWNEYSPWCRLDGTGRCDGDKYARFLIETLKPRIDREFRTLPGRESTGTAGSSLGATISFYLALKYPAVFSKAGLLSPSFWFAREEAFALAQNTPVRRPLRLYMDVGTEEGEHKDDYLNDARAMSGLLSGNFRQVRFH